MNETRRRRCIEHDSPESLRARVDAISITDLLRAKDWCTHRMGSPTTYDASEARAERDLIDAEIIRRVG